MKISIIVPVYNTEKELARCLDSILCQSHKNLEVIVVDDGSQDGSRQLIESYKSRDNRIKAIFKENGGVTSARMCGIEESTGEWIGFVDSDDEIEYDMYKRLLANAVKYQADISHCGYQMVFSDGRVNYFYNSNCIREQNAITAVRDLLEGTLVEPGLWNKLYHRSLFFNLKSKMDFSIRINEDLLMNYYLFSSAKKAVFEDWCPYHYIVRDSSASRQRISHHKLYDPVRVKEIILSDVSDELLPDVRRAFITTCIYSYCGTVSIAEPEVLEAKRYLRNLLTKRFEWCSLLPKRVKLLATMIVIAPRIFEVIYPIYTSLFQKGNYE